MLTYKYIARDPTSGKKVESIVQAPSQQAASSMVTDQGLALVSIQLQSEQSSLFGHGSKKVSTKDRVIMTRQLSTLINAGLPLVQALRSVTEQTKSKSLKVIMTKVIEDVEAGKTFSAALGRYPRVFNQIFISLVAAGEASGTLDDSLDRIANQQEKDAEIRGKVKGALVYPLVVMIVMGAVVGFMLVGVLPQVKELYKGIGGDVSLPFVTRLLLAVSDFIIKFWWLMLIMLVVAAVITTKWARTLGGKRYIDLAKIKVKPLGPLFMKMYMARFARTGTTLIASGVPLLQILDITAKSIDNMHIENSIRRAAEQVKGGKALSATLMGDPYFLELVPQMIKIGEDSGAIETMLGKTADYYEKEVDEQIKTISTIIEPVLMIILGVVAITIVVAILLPIYSLVGKNVIR